MSVVDPLVSPALRLAVSPLNKRSAALPVGWLIALTAILLLATVMRLWSINKESFWADEGWTMLLSHGPTATDVVQTMVSDQHPPLYFVLFHYWTGLVGNSEIVSRLFSTFWSLLGVALVYRLGADLFSRRAGALAALFLALAALDLMLAQETRHYTQMAMLATLSAVFYFRYLRHHGRGAGLGWWAASVALIYTHYLGAFVLLIQLLHIVFVVRPRQRMPDLLIRWGLIGLAWAPWGFVFIGQSLVRYTDPILFRSSLPNTAETFITVRTALFGAHFGLTLGLLLIGLIYVIYRSRGAWPTIRLRPLSPTMYLLLWFALPIGLIVAINSRYEILTTRNFLLILPAIALLIGHGLSNLERTAQTFLVVILVAVGVTTTDTYFVKPPWRQVAQDIIRYWNPAAEPVIMDVWVDDFALRYHLGRDLHTEPTTLPLVSIPTWLDQYKAAFFPKLLAYMHDKPAVWMADWSKDEDGVRTFLDQHGYVLTAEQTETHLDTNIIHIYRYDQPPTAPPLATFTAAGDSAPLLALGQATYPATIVAGDTLPISLWWSAKAAISKDYSVSAFLLDAQGKLIAQRDGSPFDGHSPMSGWHPGDWRFDQPHLALPAALPAGRYTVAVKVYWYADLKPLTVQGAAASPDATYVTLGTVTITDAPKPS